MKSAAENFFIKPDYTARDTGSYFEDSLANRTGITHQPDVYALARYLAHRFGCTHILDIGCGQGRKLAKFHPEFKITGIDFGSNIDYCRSHYAFGQWLSYDLELQHHEILPQEILEKTLVICSDVIEHLIDPSGLLNTLAQCLKHAPVAILSTPERDLVRGSNDPGPPANPAHVREWNLVEFSQLLEEFSLQAAFLGLTYNNDRDWEKKTILSILHGTRLPLMGGAVNDDFRVVAFMTAYNEEDIIFHSISRLVQSGVDVYLIDNCSSDGTVAAAEPLLGKGLINIERFPADGTPDTYDWAKLLERVQELTRTIPANWFIHHDADEIRTSPWPELRLREALHYVEQMGFNAVDHTVLEFRPIDSDFPSGWDFGTYFNHCEFGLRPGHFQQIKAWKNTGQPVTLAATGGHDANFTNRNVFPYKFLLRHYPVRSQAHGEKKVLRERKSRFNPDERMTKGWHTQYDHIQSGHNFIRSPDSLIFFDPSNFYQKYLVERISGIGILRPEQPTAKENLFIKICRFFGIRK